MKPEKLPEYLGHKERLRKIADKVTVLTVEDPGAPVEVMNLPYETQFEIAWQKVLTFCGPPGPESNYYSDGKLVTYRFKDRDVRLSLHFTALSLRPLRTISACWRDIDAKNSGYVERASFHPDHNRYPEIVEQRGRELNFVMSSLAAYEASEVLIDETGDMA